MARTPHPRQSQPQGETLLCLWVPPTWLYKTVCLVTAPVISQAGHWRFSEIDFGVAQSRLFIIFSAALSWTSALEMSKRCSIVPLFPSRKSPKIKMSKPPIDCSSLPSPALSVSLYLLSIQSQGPKTLSCSSEPPTVMPSGVGLSIHSLPDFPAFSPFSSKPT